MRVQLLNWSNDHVINHDKLLFAGAEAVTLYLLHSFQQIEVIGNFAAWLRSNFTTYNKEGKYLQIIQMCPIFPCYATTMKFKVWCCAENAITQINGI